MLGLILTILLGWVSTNSSSFCKKIIHLKGRGLKIEKYVLRYSKGITSVSQPENRNVGIYRNPVRSKQNTVLRKTETYNIKNPAHKGLRSKYKPISTR